jgi:hypothetical protein
MLMTLMMYNNMMYVYYRNVQKVPPGLSEVIG